MTLPEVMVVVFIFLFLAGGMAATSNVAQRFWSANRTRIELQQEIRRAVTGITGTLRETGQGGVITLADGMMIFKKPEFISGLKTWPAGEDAEIRFILDAGTHQLLKTEGGVTRVVASDILVFGCAPSMTEPDLIEIDITAQKTVSGVPITRQTEFFISLRN